MVFKKIDYGEKTNGLQKNGFFFFFFSLGRWGGFLGLPFFI